MELFHLSQHTKASVAKHLEISNNRVKYINTPKVLQVYLFTLLIFLQFVNLLFRLVIVFNMTPPSNCQTKIYVARYVAMTYIMRVAPQDTALGVVSITTTYGSFSCKNTCTYLIIIVKYINSPKVLWVVYLFTPPIFFKLSIHSLG